MSPRLRSVLPAALLLLATVGLSQQSASAAGVPQVTGMTANGSNLSTQKLGVKWTAVSGATYQVRWAPSTSSLSKARVYATTKTSALSPVLSSWCNAWYAQARAVRGSAVGPWSAAKSLVFAGLASIPGPIPAATTQTSATSVLVRWTRVPGAAGYRAHYSPAPYGNWPGFAPYTATTSATATGVTLPLRSLGPGDHFMAAPYGNPLFFQLETKRCNGTWKKGPWSLGWPKPGSPGDSTTGNRLRIGTYNIEALQSPTSTKLANIADNIASRNLDVIGLQEANGAHSTTVADLVTALGAKGQSDWQAVSRGANTVMWRSSAWSEVAEYDVGQPMDTTAATPIPAPAVRLTPAVPDPSRRDVLVVSAHLEDRLRFHSDATIPERKADAHAASTALINAIHAANPDGLPTLVAADLIGNFGSGYCDESSSPACQPEGQPTFVRAGYLDAQTAVTRANVAYSTLNKHVASPPANASGYGGRADFIVVTGFPGISTYQIVVKTYGDASAAYQSDHNLVQAELFVPKAS